MNLGKRTNNRGNYLLQEITIGSEVKAVFGKHGDETESYTLVQWELA
jgi:hypothetical protein